LILCASQLHRSDGSHVFFYLSSFVVLASAVKVITHEKPVYSALYFVLTVIAITPLLLLQEAEFLAIALVIIYAGAILVTYVFVIMLAQQGGQPVYDRRAREPFLAVFGGFLTMAIVAGQMANLPDESFVTGPSASLVDAGEPAVNASASTPANAPANDPDNTFQVGAIMMTDYVVAFEIAGVLLLVAMVGAIAMSKKRVIADESQTTDTKKRGQIGREVAPY
jgi:NADH-quinone oxidoreductase subunit J